MTILETCIEACRKKPGTVVFPDCLDHRVMAAATRLVEEKLATPVFVQSPFALKDKMLGAEKAMSGFTVINHLNKDVLAANIKTYIEIQEKNGKPVSAETAEKAMRCNVAASAMLVRQGHVEVGVAGNLSSTAAVLMAGIKVLPRKQKTVSSFFLMISPNGESQYIFADCAVVPEPSPETLADIAIASAEKARNLLQQEPKVAILSFSTKGSSKHPRAQVVRDAVDIIRSRTPEMLVDGELQLDAAIVPSVAAMKAPGSTIEGKANVLVFPSLEAGNIAYKILQRMGGYEAMGPFLQGFEGGWHDLSRGCSADDIFKVAVLGLCMQRGNIVTPGNP